MRNRVLFTVSASIWAGISAAQVCAPAPEMKSTINEVAKLPMSERLEATRAT